MRTEELDKFEEILEPGLVKICTAAGLLDGEALHSPDIEGKWNEYITRYTEDAVNNFNDYPQVTYVWAAFLGMGVAWNWDRDWVIGNNLPYESYYGSEGWDDMDEYVMYEIFGFEKEGEVARKLIDTFLSCAEATEALIRHNAIDLDSEFGFYILVRAWEVFYRIGASIALRKFGYKKVPLKNFS